MFSFDSCILDFAMISIFLFVAKILREKITFLRTCFIPASLIAGILALILGEYALNLLSFSEAMPSYSGTLMTCLAASLYLGNNEPFHLKRICNNVGDSFLMNCAAEIGQFGIFLLIGFFLANFVFPNLSSWIGILLPAGFVGSHGTAAVISPILEKYGYQDAFSIGQTFATIGLLFGVFGGIFFINLAVRKKYTTIIHSMDELPEEMKTDQIPESQRESLGVTTINAIAIDSLAYHIAVAFCAVALANGISKFLGIVFPYFEVPVYALAFVSGMIMQKILKFLKLETTIDKKIMTHISGTLTDYIVAFGIASVNLKTVVKYWPPILLLAILGMLYCTIMLLFVSKKCFHNLWFEREIFVFGWSAAAMPVAIMLLRITDPKLSSNVLEDANMAWIFLNFADLLIVTFVPVLLVNGYGILTGIFLTVIAFCMIAFCRIKYSFTH